MSELRGGDWPCHLLARRRRRRALSGPCPGQAYVTLMSQEVKSLNFAAEENYTVRLCKELVAYHYPDELPLGSFELLASNKIRSDEETVGARDHPRLEYSRFLMGGLLTPPRWREREGEQREARHAPRNRRPAIHPRPLPQLGEVFNGDEYYCDRPDEANPTLAYGPDPDAGPNAVPHPRHLPRPHPRPHPQAEDPDFDWKPRKEQVSVGAQVAHAGHNATAAGARTMRASTHAA